MAVAATSTAAHSQPLIDSKLVGGPTDGNGGYEDASKFVIAQNGVMYLTCPNGVYGSANGGVTWTALTKSSIADFCFGPDSTLFLANASGVFSSTNFGSTWVNLSLQLPNGPFYSIIATVDGTIMTGCPTGIFRSTDNGINWDHIAQSEFPSSTTGAYLTTTLTGTVMARGGTNYRSTDNGQSWTKTGPLTIQIWPVTTTNILRQSVTDQGFERSTDDGVSWHTVPGPFKGIPYDLAIDRNGWLYTFYAWQLYVSKDGGTTWTVVGTLSGGGTELAFAPDGTLFFVKSSAGVWRTLKPLSSVESQDASEHNSLDYLPADDAVRFTLDQTSHVSLSLVSLLGSEIATIQDGVFGPGEHWARIPTDGLARGCYFVILRTKGHRDVVRAVMR